MDRDRAQYRGKRIQNIAASPSGALVAGVEQNTGRILVWTADDFTLLGEADSSAGSAYYLLGFLSDGKHLWVMDQKKNLIFYRIEDLG